jgi:hypothetical protein
MMWYASHQTFSQHLLHVKKGRPGTIRRQVIKNRVEIALHSLRVWRMLVCGMVRFASLSI